ncbi:uncharacterized protein LOC120944132 isoform X2 [Rana temporaria]|uniref:uncharacterized protein LOC120920686 n=1 Tax=Rana temporaria TaxID=8407 RepID=UPI001AAD9959|nr:uncharacterized protein LOC120915229 isoform X2 [Rana temporaria]XP_040188831.1 uncharacterized protein LOC120920686 [Rana temporaria]XP_040210815.1 uncharacterized protein LOC120941478 isoform X2 [Rana temporaria]XP_040210819.1 uncharacterized protein LOC120941480 isoform X2 [Rana temporaria]XP_040213975.1 uncharacterized protein LOC120944132 isoform X2 [Rana temporaria]
MSEIQTNCNLDNEQEININQYMAKMKRLLKKKSNLHWHIEFLNKYARENISPLGLRIQVFPSFQTTIPEFKVAWEQALSTCSTQLMKLLVGHHQSELLSLEQDILLLQSNNEGIKGHTHYDKRCQDIKDFITKTTKDIIYKKQVKLSKDRFAFSEGFAYRWQAPTQYKGSRSNFRVPRNVDSNQYTTEDDTESDSSSLLPSQPPSRRNYPASTSSTSGTPH